MGATLQPGGILPRVNPAGKDRPGANSGPIVVHRAVGG